MDIVSHTGVTGLLIGNPAERILRQVDCSVLTVKPGRGNLDVVIAGRGFVA